mmetsp:Transcript_32965/g.5992  ORF Transcript_32965/g.5992 Transcript_32965/m.5992 type:complete len:92 (-) Transcript_32965:34-309(-)
MRLRYYPLILIICWIMGTINRFYLFANDNEPDFTLTFLHVMMGAFQGLFNSIVYGMNRDVLNSVRESCKFLPCCTGSKDDEVQEHELASQA